MFIPVQPEVRESVSAFVARVHKKVNEISQTYLTNERRYNYTTPKSFLEQIKLYEVTRLFRYLLSYSNIFSNRKLSYR